MRYLIKETTKNIWEKLLSKDIEDADPLHMPEVFLCGLWVALLGFIFSPIFLVKFIMFKISQLHSNKNKEEKNS